MMVRRKPVKVWQVVIIIVIILGIFMVMALKQNNYNIPNPDDPFSQQSLEKIENITGSKDELYTAGFTCPDSEKETFVIKLSAPGSNGRWQNWNLILYAEDGRMPYRVEKKEAVLELPKGAVLLSEEFPKLKIFREQKKKVFALFEEEAKAKKGESSVQLDLRDHFGEEKILLKRKSSTPLPDASSKEENASRSKKQKKQKPEEIWMKSDETAEDIMTVTVSEKGVSEKDYRSGDCSGESFLLYCSRVQNGIRTEKLLAVVNVEET